MEGKRLFGILFMVLVVSLAACSGPAEDEAISSNAGSEAEALDHPITATDPPEVLQPTEEPETLVDEPAQAKTADAEE